MPNRPSITIAPLTSGILSGVAGAVPVFLTADHDRDLMGWLAFVGISVLIWSVKYSTEHK